jgi:hypothetical protein
MEIVLSSDNFSRLLTLPRQILKQFPPLATQSDVLFQGHQPEFKWISHQHNVVSIRKATTNGTSVPGK